jgi:hypothetical protein
MPLVSSSIKYLTEGGFLREKCNTYNRSSQRSKVPNPETLVAKKSVVIVGIPSLALEILDAPFASANRKAVHGGIIH